MINTLLSKYVQLSLKYLFQFGSPGIKQTKIFMTSIYIQTNHISYYLNIFFRLKNGINKAAFICCFISPEYEKTPYYKMGLQYANKLKKRIIPCLIKSNQNWQAPDWLKHITQKCDYIYFDEISKSKIDSLISKLKDLVYVPGDYSQRSYVLFEMIKYDYMRKSRIQLFINPCQHFPIEQSYINLAIIENREQKKKENKLVNTKSEYAIQSTFEEIYNVKTPIDIKDIFEKCRDQLRQVVVFGRAGIGKSIFCRYAAYQWAINQIWSEYDLVVLIPLRSLTEYKYQPHTEYYLVDILKNQYFYNIRLSIEEEKDLTEQIRKSRVLWLLDGYDEIAQNQSAHLNGLLRQLLETSNHIVTTRPYTNLGSYNVELEITGFTDANIPKYVKQFFDKIGRQSSSYSDNDAKILQFLKQNPMIWGISHIPINLELICTAWSNTNWSEGEFQTIAWLYRKIVASLCRRQMTRNGQFTPMIDTDILKRFRRELSFLEILAFKGMTDKTNSIILRPNLIEQALIESQYTSSNFINILHIGFLKSFDEHNQVGDEVQANQNHYFVHLSFQEYFTAQYLVKILNGDQKQIQIAIDFIKQNKYNQRFDLVFVFASHLVNTVGNDQCRTTYWNSIREQSVDLVGFRHIQLLISCIDAVSSDSTIPRRASITNSIKWWIDIAVNMSDETLTKLLASSFQRTVSLAHDQTILSILKTLLKSASPNQYQTARNVLKLISALLPYNSPSELIEELFHIMQNGGLGIQEYVYDALGNIHIGAKTDNLLDKLIDIAINSTDPYDLFGAKNVLVKISKNTPSISDRILSKLEIVLNASNSDDNVKTSVCRILGKIGETTANSRAIGLLTNELTNGNDHVKFIVCDTLIDINENELTDNVIEQLLIALNHTKNNVKKSACKALKNIVQKGAKDDVINALLEVLRKGEYDVQLIVCEVLGSMVGNAVRDDVINGLLQVLRKGEYDVRIAACKTIGLMAGKVQKDNIITELLEVLRDGNINIKLAACKALGLVCQKVARDDVINKLLEALSDGDINIKLAACKALGLVGQKVARYDVINKLLEALSDGNINIKLAACEALDSIGEKAASASVFKALIDTLIDQLSHNYADFAFEILEKIIGKVTLNDDVVNKVLDILNMHTSKDTYPMINIFKTILCSITFEMSLQPGTLWKLSRNMDRFWFVEYERVQLDQFVRSYIDREYSEWLSPIASVAFQQGSAVTITETSVTIYDRKEPVIMEVLSNSLLQDLKQVLTAKIQAFERRNM